MKIPQRPPEWQVIFRDEIAKSDLMRLWDHNASMPTYGGRYLHWDKLRRLQSPDPLTHSQWWVLTKLARAPLLKPLPLTDLNGRPFQYCVPDPATELLHTLDKDAAGQILLADQIANPALRDRYIVSSLMEEAITSSQIEGAATTRVVAKEMLRSGRQPRNIGEQMIKNNYLAMQRIRLLTDRPLTVDTIFELHRVLTEGTLEISDGAGRLRRADERIVVEDAFGEVLHEPPVAGLLSDRLNALCAFANGETPSRFIHPVVRATVLHFWLAYDHPFVDGNGRCARALFYWSMLRSGYWLCEFISISQLIRAAQVEYGRAFLYTETDDNDLTYFILYHLDLIRRGIDNLQSYIKRKMSDVREAERLVRDNDSLNHRQIALLSHALRHPDAAYTITSHQTSNNTVYQTARSDLLKLVELGFLQSSKRRKTFQFFPVSDLEARMRPKQSKA